MTILFNNDSDIPGNEKFRAHFMDLISAALSRFGERITRVEVRLTDIAGRKDGASHNRCAMDVRIKGRGPFAVTHMDETAEQAITGALRKLSMSMESINSLMSKHRL
jgi:hypothetical protein